MMMNLKTESFTNIVSRLPVVLISNKPNLSLDSWAWQLWTESLVFYNVKGYIRQYGFRMEWAQITASHCNQFNFHVCSMESAYGARNLPVVWGWLWNRFAGRESSTILRKSKVSLNGFIQNIISGCGSYPVLSFKYPNQKYYLFIFGSHPPRKR